MNKIFWLLAISITFQKCSLQKQEQKSQSLVYQIEKINLTNDFSFRFKEVTCKEDSGRIKIIVELENQTPDLVKITLVDWELETPEGTRSLAVRVNSPSLEIGRNGSTKLDFLFEPTNSLKLFRETGLKGVLAQSYQFLYRGKRIIDLKASDANYSFYKKDKKEPVVFFPSMNDDFKNTELTYLKNNLGLKENGMEIHEQEVLLDGVNLVLNAYHYNDTLVVKLKLVNHSLFPIRVKLGAMNVQIGNKKLLSAVKHQDGEVTIPRSQRGYIEERYPISNLNTDHFLLHISPIDFMTQKPVPLFFCEQISLKRSQ